MHILHTGAWTPVPATPAKQCLGHRVPTAPEGTGRSLHRQRDSGHPIGIPSHHPSHLVDLLPAVLVHAAEPGVVVQQELAAVGIPPHHGTVVQGRQPPAVLVVRGGTQVQQRLQEKRPPRSAPSGGRAVGKPAPQSVRGCSATQQAVLTPSSPQGSRSQCHTSTTGRAPRQQRQKCFGAGRTRPRQQPGQGGRRSRCWGAGQRGGRAPREGPPTHQQRRVVAAPDGLVKSCHSLPRPEIQVRSPVAQCLDHLGAELQLSRRGQGTLCRAPAETGENGHVCARQRGALPAPSRERHQAPRPLPARLRHRWSSQTPRARGLSGLEAAHRFLLGAGESPAEESGKGSLGSSMRGRNAVAGSPAAGEHTAGHITHTKGRRSRG